MNNVRITSSYNITRTNRDCSGEDLNSVNVIFTPTSNEDSSNVSIQNDS
jgi:hypothetical protein